MIVRYSFPGCFNTGLWPTGSFACAYQHLLLPSTGPNLLELCSASEHYGCGAKIQRSFGQKPMTSNATEKSSEAAMERLWSRLRRPRGVSAMKGSFVCGSCAWNLLSDAALPYKDQRVPGVVSLTCGRRRIRGRQTSRKRQWHLQTMCHFMWKNGLGLWDTIFAVDVFFTAPGISSIKSLQSRKVMHPTIGEAIRRGPRLDD